MWRATSYRAHSQFSWEVIGSTWRCIKQKRDVRVLLWGKAPAPDRLRPAEPTQHSRPSVDGLRIVALLPRIVVALSARTLPVPLRSRTPTV